MTKISSIHIENVGNCHYVLVEIEGTWYEVISDNGQLISHTAEIDAWSSEMWEKAKNTPRALNHNALRKRFPQP